MGKNKLELPENQDEVNAVLEESAKELNKVKKEVKETSEIKNEIIKDTFETAQAEINEGTETKITTATTIENGETITESSITISAGADQRIMDLKKAKTIFDEKKNKLIQTKDQFSKDPNKEQIQKVINELSSQNIESKIKDSKTGKKDNREQLGNRYLIAARIAEGFIQVLEKLPKKNKEPNLTLTIDWEKCSIGEINKDIEGDRFINIALTMEVKKGNGSDEGVDIEKNNNIQKGNVINAVNTYTNNNRTSNTNTGGNVGATTGVETGRNSNGTSGPNINTNGEGEINRRNKNNVEILTNKETLQPFIEERIRISISKDFKRNGNLIDKNKNITKIQKTNDENKFYVTINDKQLLFSFTPIDKDRNFDKNEEGKLKIKEDDKKYYEAKLETNERTDMFKVYTITQNGKNIQVELDQEKTKTAFNTYYTLDSGYSIDPNTTRINPDTLGDVENITTNIIFTLPNTITKINPKKKQDILENVIFDKNGEIQTDNGNVYEKIVGTEDLTLLTTEKDNLGNYKKEIKKLNYYIKLNDKSINIINDEITINTDGMVDRNDNKIASEVENGEKTQEEFSNYTVDLGKNFKKRQINALGGDKYELLCIPNISGIDENKYIHIPFTYTHQADNQTRYFKFDTDKLTIPEKYTETGSKEYFVVDGLYYKVDIPNGQQASINPKIFLDYPKTEEETIKKTNKTNKNSIQETEQEIDHNSGGKQKRDITLLNNIIYNTDNYTNFSINEAEKQISYTREISLDEILGYDNDKKTKLILGTIKFNGNGEIIETTDRLLKVNKKNQTLEINNLFGREKTLAIPFEIDGTSFIIGTNSDEKAKYIVDEFEEQKKYLKNRIYDEKAIITTKINQKIKEMGTQRADEFPGLALSVPVKGLRKESNTETIDALNNLKGPTSEGIYFLKINNAYTKGETAKEQFLYFKIKGNDVQLTDIHGNDVTEIYLESNKEYKPGKGLIKIEKDLTITTIQDVEEQKTGYPNFKNEPESIKNHLTKTIEQGDSAHYDREDDGSKYMRIFGNSRVGYITSIPITSEEENPNKYLYNEKGIQYITEKEIAEDLRDYDNFKELNNLGGLNERELKDIFKEKFEAHKDISSISTDNLIRIKNNEGKYEYREISGEDKGNKITFEEEKITKKIQKETIDDMKKDLLIIASLEHLQLRYRRSDQRQKKETSPWNKAGNRAIQDIEKEKIKDFIQSEDKKIIVKILGPANNEEITLSIDKGVYKKITSADLETNGYYKGLFKSELDDTSTKKITVQDETYTVHLEENEKDKQYQIIFESEVSKS